MSYCLIVFVYLPLHTQLKLLKQKQKVYEKEESTITAGGTKKVNKTFCALSLVLGVGEFCVFHAINGKGERFISE